MDGEKKEVPLPRTAQIAIMRKVDVLVIEYPDTYKCMSETGIDKIYSMPKSFVSYRKPRMLSEEQRLQKKKMMMKLNSLSEQ